MIVFDVLGVPAPQGSKSAVQQPSGKIVVIEGKSKAGRAKLQAWREAVAWAAVNAKTRLGDIADPKVPARLDIQFVMPKPASRAKRERWVVVKPDLDKLVRATCDGLADGRIIGRDQQLAAITATKRYAAPDEATGARIALTALDQADAPTCEPALGELGAPGAR